MKIMKKFLILLFFIFFITTGFSEEVKVYFFWSNGCSHCKKEKIFLSKLEKKYPDIEILSLEVSKIENQKLLNDFSEKLDITVSSLPITIIKDRYFVGFLNEETSGRNIEKAILEAREKKQIIKKPEPLKSIKVPFIGTIELKNISLPLLTIIIGAIDGFNPCAMWALVMLISFLIPMQNRKKMFLLGGVFIFVSAFVYFLFMVAWLNFIVFFKYIGWIKILIGLVAVIGGAYYLKEFFTNKEGSCKVTSSKLKMKISDKMTFLTENKGLFFAIIGISVLAFLVNLIELICSAGLPVIYIQILNLSSLSMSQYYLYILLYIFIFMLDDLLIFTIAMFSLHLMRITTKYTRFSHLLGGIILLIVGTLLIFKPEYLMF